VEQALEAGEWPRAVESLLRLAAPVDRIFDDVLIMAPDAAVRANRLALLASVAALFRQVADFSKVVMANGTKAGSPSTPLKTNRERRASTTKRT
jgi:glycyl-tRNA synthetase beta subunit